MCQENDRYRLLGENMQEVSWLDMFFSQSLHGSFFMMLDEPVVWNESIDKEKALDYIIMHLRMTKVNQALLDQYRASEAEIVGLNFYDLFKHDPEEGRNILRGLLDVGSRRLETMERRMDGTEMWVESDCTCMYDGQGRFISLFGIQVDITERKQKEKSGLSAEDVTQRRIAHSAVDISDSEGMVSGVVMDCSNVTEQSNAGEDLRAQFQFEKMVSNISSYFVSLPTEQLCRGINNVLKIMGEFFQVDRSYVFQFTEGQRMNNTHEWCSEEIEPQIDVLQNIPSDMFPWWMEKLTHFQNIIIPCVDEMSKQAAVEKRILQEQDIKSVLVVPIVSNNKVMGFMGFDAVKSNKIWTEEHVTLLRVVAELISNVISRYLAEEKIRHLIFHDSLTGLYNRVFLEQEMQRLDTKRQLPISMIMCDLNGLKLINDTYGHSTGDEMLVRAANILRKYCREKDIIARWSGDEFVVLLPQTTIIEAAAICKRIVQECEKLYVKKAPLSMALGTAGKNSMDKGLTETLKEAENNMYKHKLAESRSTKSAVLNALLKTLEEKSYETEEHGRRMQQIAMKIGEKINLPETELDRLTLLVYLHDIGKITIPEEILTKMDKLTENDWACLKKHPESGYRIARSMEEFAHVAEDILCHHEHWNGLGYPKGLKGKDIPILARIVNIVDAYEVMTNGRPYKQPLCKSEVIAELKRCAGTQFDPELMQVFLSILEV
ncbi:HD domain-containing phosphohydrolase [Candidatus Contubernalis alkaliaceticus]|uniref:HD domain-containing phosphohydrolase n=1 Tax=Candidatus Contubernalis alkaliaceticus TaxID=338645 RepID=UPI001F4C3B7A|nr:HD domain-containing phosphohydrolase [Candidatus Contubernalis alkalaceticus]UNC93421.1 diguanylate cyclase [Candidatus Contubernalis alkalaceticus]